MAPTPDPRNKAGTGHVSQETCLASSSSRACALAMVGLFRSPRLQKSLAPRASRARTLVLAQGKSRPELVASALVLYIRFGYTIFNTHRIVTRRIAMGCLVSGFAGVNSQAGAGENSSSPPARSSARPLIKNLLVGRFGSPTKIDVLKKDATLILTL